MTTSIINKDTMMMNDVRPSYNKVLYKFICFLCFYLPVLTSRG